MRPLGGMADTDIAVPALVCYRVLALEDRRQPVKGSMCLLALLYATNWDTMSELLILEWHDVLLNSPNG